MEYKMEFEISLESVQEFFTLIQNNSHFVITKSLLFPKGVFINSLSSFFWGNGPAQKGRN